LTFFQTNDGTWDRSIDRHGRPGSPIKAEQLLADRQIDDISAERNL
jgi:hypothetical protein